MWREGVGEGVKGIYMETPQKQRTYDIRAIHTSFVVCVYLGTGTPQKQRSLRARYIDLYYTYVSCVYLGMGTPQRQRNFGARYVDNTATTHKIVGLFCRI